MVQCRCQSCDALVGEFELTCGACGAALGSAPVVACGPEPSGLADGARLGRYRIAKRLGSGTMGEVYRAFDETLGRDVALKVLRPELVADRSARARFLREARILCRVRHPFVGTIFDAVEGDGTPALVMELHEGETLAALLKRGPLPVERAARIAHDVAMALDAVHAAGIVHRDLKPSNVIVLPNHEVRVVDFGLSKVLSSPDALLDGDVPRTSRGQLVGTVAYMAPEQVQGEAAGPASDMWALGVVLFEMIMGARPFGSARSILTEAPELRGLAERSTRVAEVVASLLQKDVRDRATRASEVAGALVESATSAATAPVVERPVVQAGQLVGERFELLRALATNDRADVWTATDRRSRRDVVVKLLHPSPEAGARLEREHALVRRIQSAQVVSILARGVFRDRPYLVMEKIDGVTLAERLSRGPLAVDDIVAIGVGLADAVQAIHGAGVVHGDLTPSNILLADGDAGLIHVVDFECARSSEDPEPPQARTITGTVPYMSPELAEGTPATFDSDLWALGVILFEVAVGHRPFEAASAARLLATLHLQARPVPSARRPELTRAFDAFWLRCSAAESMDRPPDASAWKRELISALGAHAADRAATARTAMSERPTRPPGKKRWQAAAAAMALVAAVTSAAVVLLTSERRAQPTVAGSGPTLEAPILVADNVSPPPREVGGSPASPKPTADTVPVARGSASATRPSGSAPSSARARPPADRRPDPVKFEDLLERRD